MSGTATSPDFDLDLALEGLTMREDIHEMEYLIKCLGEQIEVTKERYVNFKKYRTGFGELFRG